MTLWAEQEKRRGLVEQTQENSTRLQSAFATYSVTGLTFNDSDSSFYSSYYNTAVEPKVFNFGMAFTTLPHFSHAISLGEDADLPNDFYGNVVMPFHQAGVHKWRQNSDGFYTGAWCWFKVLFDGVNGVVDRFTGNTIDTDPTFEVVFHLHWTQVASKDFIRSPNFNVADLETDQ